MKRETFAVEGGEGLPLSDAVRFGDLVFVSGMVAFDEDGLIVEGGIAAETRQVFRNIERVRPRRQVKCDQSYQRDQRPDAQV